MRRRLLAPLLALLLGGVSFASGCASDQGDAYLPAPEADSDAPPEVRRVEDTGGV